MTPDGLITCPALDEVDEYKTRDLRSVYVKSPIMKGIAGLLIESNWAIDHDAQTITFTSSNLISKFERVPLTPFNVPDRHLRAVRKIGASLFDVKRFDGLVLFPSSKPHRGFLAARGEEQEVFVEKSDAELWLIQKEPEESNVSEQKLTTQEIPIAQRNSAEIRTELLRLMVQTVTGTNAQARLLTLLRRGCDPTVLEKIWGDAHDHNDLPEDLRGFLWKETEERTKI
jgi:hypothetical protein